MNPVFSMWTITAMLAFAEPDAVAPAGFELEIEFDVVAQHPSPDSLRNDLRDGANARLRESLRIDSTEGAPLPRFKFVVQADNAGGFSIDVEGTRPGRPEVKRHTTCDECLDPEAVEKAMGALDEIVSELNALPSTEPSPPPKTNAAIVVPPNDDETQPPRRMTKLGWTGVGFFLGGAAIMGFGGWQVNHVETRGRAPLYLETETKNFRPLGITLLTVGSAVAAAGIVMFAVDVTRQSKRRKSTSFLQPVLGPQLVGAAACARF